MAANSTLNKYYVFFSQSLTSFVRSLDTFVLCLIHSNMKTQSILLFLLAFLYVSTSTAQEIPAVYSNIFHDESGYYFLHPESGDRLEEANTPVGILLENLIQAAGTAPEGLLFDFKDTTFAGTLYYGFIVADQVRYPQPVWYINSEKVIQGRALVRIAPLKGKYDIIGWQEKGKGLLGYRLADHEGKLIYDGRVSFTGKGPFEPSTTVYEGPFVQLPESDAVKITFRTNYLTSPHIVVNGTVYREQSIMMNPLGSREHSIRIDKLKPETKYEYELVVGDHLIRGSFKTAPPNGSRKPIRFGYASDSREGKEGGERSIRGVNMHIIKKIAALANYQSVDFWQFTGDLINGYSTSTDETRIQYANWKRSVEPFWHHIPVVVGMGNHESIMSTFGNTRRGVAVDKFPFAENSAEKVFADEFHLPQNGPLSEDGAVYDPDTARVDFPSYKENVFYYTYGNIAMVVLNSNYWYAPSDQMIPLSGGNPHAYVMDNQLKWLAETINKLEANNKIDHIFITIHTPMFPNGGHAGDDMWYHGNNDVRPFIAGLPVEKGIIERRDEILDIIVNKSKKSLAVLTGDEHNYSRLFVDDEMNRYPDEWPHSKLKLNRHIWQITNGSAGAPHYGQEVLPWSGNVQFFSLQYALVFFEVNGEKVHIKVINPDTLEEIESVKLR